MPDPVDTITAQLRGFITAALAETVAQERLAARAEEAERIKQTGLAMLKEGPYLGTPLEAVVSQAFADLWKRCADPTNPYYNLSDAAFSVPRADLMGVWPGERAAASPPLNGPAAPLGRFFDPTAPHVYPGGPAVDLSRVNDPNYGGRPFNPNSPHVYAGADAQHGREGYGPRGDFPAAGFVEPNYAGAQVDPLGRRAPYVEDVDGVIPEGPLGADGFPVVDPVPGTPYHETTAYDDGTGYAKNLAEAPPRVSHQPAAYGNAPGAYNPPPILTDDDNSPEAVAERERLAKDRAEVENDAEKERLDAAKVEAGTFKHRS